MVYEFQDRQKLHSYLGQPAGANSVHSTDHPSLKYVVARISLMRRWFIILLLTLLPLQLSWAAVSTYCQHETGAAAQHFGHHEHQHHADEKAKDDTGTKTLGAVDADCPSCHAGCATALHASTALPMVYSAADVHTRERVLFSSPHPSLPERPNWAHLA